MKIWEIPENDAGVLEYGKYGKYLKNDAGVPEPQHVPPPSWTCPGQQEPPPPTGRITFCWTSYNQLVTDGMLSVTDMSLPMGKLISVMGFYLC